jgi:hypothetical protein
VTQKGSGSGKAGVLHIRTPDHRWVEVPYGAGQDSKLRSVNVWNGDSWMCPTWGRLLWQDMFTDPGLLADLDSLLYRPKNVVWTGWADHVNHVDTHVYNPTYRHHDPGSQQFTFSYEPAWIRLFYLTPRTEPTYRIVPLNYPLPSRPPNRTLDYDLESDARNTFSTMWPSFTYKADLSGDGLPASAIDNPTADWGTATHDTNITTYQGVNLPELCRSVYIHQVGPVIDWDFPLQTWTTDYRGSLAGMIDLKTIRQRLEDVYPEQDVTYTGQKNNIGNQELQWVIVKFQIKVSLTYWVAAGEEQPGGTDFDPVTFTLRSDLGIPTSTETQALQPIAGLYRSDYNYPLSTDPQGQTLWSVSAQSLNHRMVVENRDVGIRPDTPRYWNQYAVSGTVELEQMFQYPGEVNIAFFAEIFNPVPWKDDFSELTIHLDAYYHRIALGYRDYSTTFPEELITWDAHP